MTEEQKKWIGRLFGQYERSLYRYVYHRLLPKNRSMTEDIVQSIFEKIMDNIDQLQLEDEIAVRNYILKIAHNLCFNLNRDNRKLSNIDPELEEEVLPSEEPVAETNVCYHELLEIVAELPVNYADVMILRGVHGFSYEHIGRIMGVKDATARKWMSRARQIIRENKSFDSWK